jgi:hypothetical protein
MALDLGIHFEEVNDVAAGIGGAHLFERERTPDDIKMNV